MKKAFPHYLLAIFLLQLICLHSRAANFYPQDVYKIVSNIGNSMGIIYGDHYAPGGHAVDATQYDGGAYQQWQFADAGNGYYTIRNRDSRQYMSYDASSQLVGVHYYTGGPEQLWSVIETPANSGNFQFRPSTVSAPLVVVEQNAKSDGSYAGVRRNYTVGTSQYTSLYNFSIIDVSFNGGIVQNGVFNIINNNSNKALAVVEDASNNQVIQLPPTNLSYAEWFMQATTGGYYAIIHRKSARVLEIGGDQSDWGQPGTKADIWYNYAFNGDHPNQEWAFLDVNNSQMLTIDQVANGMPFKLYNRNSGKVLEIGGGGTNNYDTANQWYDYSHPWQQWHLVFDSYNRVGQFPTTTQPMPSLLSHGKLGDELLKGKGTAQSPVSEGNPTASIVSSGRALELFPSPAHDVLWIALPIGAAAEGGIISITDMRGSIVATCPQSEKLSIADLEPGLYLLSVRQAGRLFQQRFVKN